MKTYRTFLKLISGLIFCTIMVAILYSCGAGSKAPETAEAWKSDSLQASENKSFMDTSQQTTVKKTARLGYTYPPEMTRMKSYDINAYVSIVNPGSYIKDTLMKIITQQKDPATGVSSEDSVKIVDNILLYKRLKIELQDPDSAFKIKTLFGGTWQDVDSTGDNRWRWNVTPITNSPENPEGKPKDIDDRTFHIKIKITGFWQMLRTWWIYLQDNPGMVVTVILIPLIAYLGKRYFDRRSKNQNP
jgi:hypothetical protein